MLEVHPAGVLVKKGKSEKRQKVGDDGHREATFARAVQKHSARGLGDLRGLHVQMKIFANLQNI